MTPRHSRHVLEAYLEDLFRRQVSAIGGMVQKVAPTERGMPDRIVLLPGGQIYLVELKREGEAPSPIQALWHARAAQRGTEVVVLHGEDEIKQWVRYHADELYFRDHPGDRGRLDAPPPKGSRRRNR